MYYRKAAGTRRFGPNLEPGALFFTKKYIRKFFLLGTAYNAGLAGIGFLLRFLIIGGNS